MDFVKQNVPEWLYAGVVVVLSVIGTVTGASLVLAPLPVFREVERRKDVGKVHFAPTLCQLFNGALWIIYGLIVKDLLIMGLNSFTTFISLRSLMILFAFDSRKRIIEICVAIYFSAITIFMAVFTFIPPLTPYLLLGLGIFCSIAVCLIYVSPILAVIQAVRFCTTDPIPLPSNLANLFNGCLWVFYGIWTGQPAVCIPNLGGVAIGLISMIAWSFIFDKKKFVQRIRNLGKKKSSPLPKEDPLSTPNGEKQENHEDSTASLNVVTPSTSHDNLIAQCDPNPAPLLISSSSTTEQELHESVQDRSPSPPPQPSTTIGNDEQSETPIFVTTQSNEEQTTDTKKTDVWAPGES